MSGFGGFCAWDGEPIATEQLTTLASYLAVAGPDGGGTVQPAPWLALQAHVLHFDRWSSRERQPHPFARRSVLLWDGRLDNREDLLVRLHQELGADETDAALVAAAYVRWGLEALPRLLGDWCLAIWDDERQQLVLARDYMGNRPLFYRNNLRRLTWSTRLDAIAAAENLGGSPEDLYIARFLMSGDPRDVTPFAGVLQVPAGRVLIATRHRLEVRRYWFYTPRTLRYRTADEYGEHLRELLLESVRVRLRATRRVWAHLSGGWDSSSVVCLAHRLIKRGCVDAPAIQPVSIVFDAPEAAEEAYYMHAVEAWCGLTKHQLTYHGRPLYPDMIGQTVPLPTHDGFELELPVSAAGDHIVLTGAHGDSLTGPGTPLVALWEAFDDGRPIETLRAFKAYSHEIRSPLASVLVQAGRQRYLASRSSVQRAAAYTRASKSRRRRPAAGSALVPEWQQRLEAWPPLESPDSSDFPPMIRATVDSLYRTANKGMLGTYEWHRPVVWLTHPYNHRPVVEFLLAVPASALYEVSFPRAGMRRALADILPPPVLDRDTKIGLHATACRRTRHAQADLMRQGPPLAEPIEAWLLLQRGVVNASRWAADRQAAQAGADPSIFLYNCIVLEAWLRSLPPAAASVRVGPSAYAAVR